MRNAFLCLSMCASLLPSAVRACEISPGSQFVQLRITQPVLASVDGGATQSIEVAHDGCVNLRYPAWDTRAGAYAYRLDSSELQDLRVQLRTTRIADFDREKVRADLDRRELEKRSETNVRTEFRISDEEVIELSFRDGAEAASSSVVVWSGLRQQMLNFPDQTELVALAAARNLLLELADDPRKRRSVGGGSR